MALSMMVLASVGMYETLGSSKDGLRWVLIGFFIAANILVMITS